MSLSRNINSLIIVCTLWPLFQRIRLRRRESTLRQACPEQLLSFDKLRMTVAEGLRVTGMSW
jgi:protein-S-isoprenylcysteine O-methyltransferase Ste14